jgi:hypothetical protein
LNFGSDFRHNLRKVEYDKYDDRYEMGFKKKVDVAAMAQTYKQTKKRANRLVVLNNNTTGTHSRQIHSIFTVEIYCFFHQRMSKILGIMMTDTIQPSMKLFQGLR